MGDEVTEDSLGCKGGGKQRRAGNFGGTGQVECCDCTVGRQVWA